MGKTLRILQAPLGRVGSEDRRDLPCNALLLLLMRSLVVAGPESFVEVPRVSRQVCCPRAATWPEGVAFRSP